MRDQDGTAVYTFGAFVNDLLQACLPGGSFGYWSIAMNMYNVSINTWTTVYANETNFNPKSLTQLYSFVSFPAPRFLHSAVRIGSNILIYGGLSTLCSLEGSLVLADLWRFDLINSRWTMLGVFDDPAHFPGPRCVSVQVHVHVFCAFMNPCLFVTLFCRWYDRGLPVPSPSNLAL
jgi:hypothetical protein